MLTSLRNVKIWSTLLLKFTFFFGKAELSSLLPTTSSVATIISDGVTSWINNLLKLVTRTSTCFFKLVSNFNFLFCSLAVLKFSCQRKTCLAAAWGVRNALQQRGHKVSLVLLSKCSMFWTSSSRQSIWLIGPITSFRWIFFSSSVTVIDANSSFC